MRHTLFGNYLLVAFRFMWKNPAYTLITVLGLAIGMACSLLITLYVEDELAYDRFHEDADRIFRLRVERFASGGAAEYTSTASAPMLPAVLNDVPQIGSGTRLYQRTLLVELDNVSSYEDRFFYVDSDFFNVFSFQLVQGDPESALREPNGLVLTESTATRYFGDTPALGRTLEVEGVSMTVTGIVRDPPSQSHFDFALLGSFSTLESQLGPSSTWGWWGLSFHTYLKLLPGANLASVQTLIRELPSRYVADQEEDSGYRQFLYLQPLLDIHLNSNYRYELGDNSQKEYVIAFSAVALFLLTLACVNFVNLSTARSAERAREVGMRKVVGAGRAQLVMQYLGESVCVALLALAVALVLVQVSMPLFNDLAQKSLSVNFVERWPLMLSMVAGAAVIGLISGLYPALVLSAFKPVDVLKGSENTSGSVRTRLRHALVVFQFAISVVLIAVALISQRQVNHMLEADVGFDKEQMLVINGRNTDVLTSQFEAFKASLNETAGVQGAAVSSSVPGRSMGSAVTSRQRGMNEDGQTFYYLAVDYDFIGLYGLEVKAGRAFSRDMVSDDSQAFMLNEAAYKALEWDEAEQALGQELTRQFSLSRTVIGVLADYNYQSLQYAVEPLVLLIAPTSYVYASVKVSATDVANTVSDLERVWKSFAPNRPFDYFFLDEDFDNHYRTEIQISQLLNMFTLLAIGIACLGLFALASFTTQRRRKEIAVRKVLGASSGRLVFMLCTSLARPVIAAAVIAMPLAWLVGRRWLETFASRVPIGWDVFGISVGLVLTVAMLTVAWQAIDAALQNPVIALRAE